MPTPELACRFHTRVRNINIGYIDTTAINAPWSDMSTCYKVFQIGRAHV